MTDTIRAAAHAVAGARQKTAGTAHALAEAQSVADKLREHVTALETERAGIITAARGGGAHDPTHALRVGVIDADLQDMKPMTDDANAGVAAAKAQDHEARQAVVRAEQQFAMATDAELERRLAEHAAKLDALLLATLNELTAVGKRVGRARPVFVPSPELANTLHRLHLTANQVRR
jgi:dihydroxyacetone kinase-like predicted kinase